MTDLTSFQIATPSGHRFEVSQRAGQYDVEWLTGPKKGHRFGIAGSNGANLSVEEVEEMCELFLAEVNLEAGYLE